MKRKPKFKKGDRVLFNYLEELKKGTIDIVDPRGTFKDVYNVNYDIMVDDENCLYKHIREKDILCIIFTDGAIMIKGEML